MAGVAWQERIDLTKFKYDELHALFKEKGFVRHEEQEMEFEDNKPKDEM